jgi:sigma-B regulation protein RsbU (phosphoserine phosphatase)
MSADDLDTAPCGYLSFDDTGRILKVNKTLLTLLGYTAADHLIGKSVESIFTIATRIFYQTHFFPLLKLHGNADEIFLTLIGADRCEWPVVCNAVRKQDGGAAANHCIFVVASQRSKYEQEILTARREAEAALLENRDLIMAKAESETKGILLAQKLDELRRANEDIVEFGRLISHDLQEPIRKIAIFTDRLAAENKEVFNQGIINRLNKINRECYQLRHLSNNLERYLSLNIHAQALADVDLNKCVHTGLSTAREASTPVELTLSVAKLPTIRGYQSQLELLFSQIFSNCIEYRDEKRALAIRVECSRHQENIYKKTKDHYKYVDFVKISVVDNGRGFDKADAKSIFSIQRRIGKSSRELSFGLPISKKVVDNHFGTIAIDPVDGGGAAVSIVLPLSPA